MQEMGLLRCSSCGAPLPADSGSSPIVTCQYCGVTQQRIDAEKYYDQLRSDVYRWVQSMVPAGPQAAGQIDSVARAQIFESSIRQNVESIQNSTNMQLLTVCSNQLLVPPFISPPASFAAAVDPKSVLNEAAKLQGISPFAQTDQQGALLRDTTVSSETLGYVSNAMRIFTSNSNPISYLTITRNFRSASESLSKDPTRTAGARRMSALATAYEGIAALMQANLYDAQQKFVSATSDLEDAQKTVIQETSIISWFAGIKSELSILDSLKTIVIALQAGVASGLSGQESLKRLMVYSVSFESARKSIGPILKSGDRIEPDTYRELSSNFATVNMARAGQKPVKVLGGSGAIWIACWLVDINYTFATGALFMKKGMMVQDRIVLPSLFPMNSSRLIQSPEDVVTDVFSLKAPSSYWERMRGKEKSLTQDVGFASDSQLRDAMIPSGVTVIPPLSTKFDAERATALYLERVRQKLQDKLRLGIPSVSKLVYAAGNLQPDGRFAVSQIPSTIQPSIGIQSQLLSFAI